MLAKPIQDDLKERYGARINRIEPYTAINSDGETEQFYEVHMTDTEKFSFYLNVDEYGAVCGDMVYPE